MFRQHPIYLVTTRADGGGRLRGGGGGGGGARRGCQPVTEKGIERAGVGGDGGGEIFRARCDSGGEGGVALVVGDGVFQDGNAAEKISKKKKKLVWGE